MNFRNARVAAFGALGLAVALAVAAAQASAQGGPDLETPQAGAQVASVELQRAKEKRQELRAQREEWTAKSAEYRKAAQELPRRIEAIEKDIERSEQRKAFEVRKGASAAELDAQLVQAELDLAEARRELTGLDAEAGSREERRKKLPELMASAKQRLNEMEGAVPPSGGDPALLAVLQELVELKHQVAQAEIEAYQSELETYEARGVLLSKRRDRTALRISYLEALTGELRELKQRMQRLEVERETEASKKLLEELTALPDGFRNTLHDLYQRNEALASAWTGEGGLQTQIGDVSAKLSRAEAKVAAIEAELTRLAARVEAVGLADSVGVLLRRHRAEAPDIGMYRRFIRMRKEQIGGVQLQLIKLREQRQALANVDALVDEAMASVHDEVSPSQRADLEDLLRQVFTTQRRYMDALLEGYETYFQKLVDFDARQQELIDRTKDLLDFIDERILWIPSGRAVQPELFSDGRDAIGWLLTATNWAQLGKALRDAAARLWLLNVIVLLLAILFAPVARRAKIRIARLGEQALKPSCARFGPTGEALALTTLLAMVLPAFGAYVGWRLGVSPAATQFTRSLAHGLLTASVAWASLRLLRQLVRPGGVAEAHCAWPATAAHALWRDLRWLSAVLVPATFLIFVFEMRGEDLWRESIGRLAFLIAMLAVTAFNFLVLRSNGPLSEVWSGRVRRRPWIWRAVHVGSVLLPLLLGVAAVRGFYWTALQVAIRLHLNLCFVFLLLIIVELAARWSLVSQRRAALEGESQETGHAATIKNMEVSRLMIGTGVLLAILGSLAIWADLLPATRILQQVDLWTTTETVTVSRIDPSGAEQVSTEDRLVAITLADLFRSLLIGLLTLALIRALPGLLEVTFFRRLSRGERYAYATIVKYAVALAGLALAFDAIGIGWSNIQWLVAAVGLGLGFGLQEIFANFISGLIILFERPIRVGDTVTVGDVSGTVTKIQIRATWITAFDRKELIVPNKEFVTGRLINWTLTDSILRLEIPIGIAYGANTELAIEILQRVASESGRVLRNPPPEVLFLGFGDSSLSFELRVFVRSVVQLFPARHELHMAVDEAFREAGVEIAFPQRDLHIRSLPEQWNPPSSDST